MKYILENVKLRKVTEGQNAGSLFIQADAVNPDDLWDAGGQVTTFLPRLVDTFAKYLAPAEMGDKDNFGHQQYKPSKLLDANKPLPEQLTTLEFAEFKEFVFPNGPMIMLDGDGKPRTDPKTGEFLTRASIRVLTKKIRNNEGEGFIEAPGFGLIEQGNSIMKRLYAPLSRFMKSADEVVLSQSGDIQTNPATQPSAATPAV